MPRNTGDCVERCRKNSRFISSSQPTASFEHPMASSTKPARWKSASASPEQSTSAESTPSPSISSLTATGNRISTCFGICRALATRARAKFHCELQKLRKPGVADVTTPGVPLPTLTQELGHEPLAATEDYPVHVKKAETKKAVVDADSFPSPRPKITQDCKDEC